MPPGQRFRPRFCTASTLVPIEPCAFHPISTTSHNCTNGGGGASNRRIREAWLFSEDFSNRLWRRAGVCLFHHFVEVVEAQL